MNPRPQQPEVNRGDLVIVGGGVAGLYAALCVAREAKVTLIAKGPLRTSASYLAQGGVAAALGEDDDPAEHAADTLEAGRGLSRRERCLHSHGRGAGEGRRSRRPGRRVR